MDDATQVLKSAKGLNLLNCRSLAAVRLDSSVLTIIFQFAAPHRMRQIYTCT
jgi:hypothetical protein